MLVEHAEAEVGKLGVLRDDALNLGECVGQWVGRHGGLRAYGVLTSRVICYMLHDIVPIELVVTAAFASRIQINAGPHEARRFFLRSVQCLTDQLRLPLFRFYELRCGLFGRLLVLVLVDDPSLLRFGLNGVAQ